MQPPRFFAAPLNISRGLFLKALRIGLPIVCLTSSMACSLYRSEDRKDFESRAPQALGIQSSKPVPQSTSCDEITQITYWYETRFPAPQTEWLESLPHLEVWLDHLPNSNIQIRTYENHSQSQASTRPITRCLAIFHTFEEWKKYRSFYLKSLEGEQP